MKGRNAYNNKLDKLKQTNGKEMQNENDHFLKIEPEATTSETKNHNNRNSITSTATINEEDTVSTTGGNTTTGNKIINLLDQSLTEGQIELLKLGLTLSPTRKFDLNAMKNDLFAFIRKLRLICHFTDINENEINSD